MFPNIIYPHILLRLALPNIVEPLLCIHNICITNVFTKKQTDRYNPNNFRPIFFYPVLFFFQNLLKGIFANYLSILMEKHNLFNTLQSGFRPKHSCYSPLSAMCYMWLSAIDRFDNVGAMFIDFEKSFGLVDRTALQQK